MTFGAGQGAGSCAISQEKGKRRAGGRDLRPAASRRYGLRRGPAHYHGQVELEKHLTDDGVGGRAVVSPAHGVADGDGDGGRMEAGLTFPLRILAEHHRQV